MATLQTGELTAHHPKYNAIKEFFAAESSFGSDIVDYFIRKGACIVLAVDEETLIGLSVNFSVDGHGVLTTNENFMAFVHQSGLDLAKTVAACVYVKPAYAGQGLADKMTLARCLHSLEHGYTHQVCFSFESPEIFAYTQSISGNVDTGATDEYGYPIIVRSLQDGIDSMHTKGVTI